MAQLEKASGKNCRLILTTATDGFTHSPLLICTGAFAWLWIIARACVQSITIDEADTFLAYVIRRSPTHWEASANNHVLNSLLMRLSTSVLGASHLTLRLPALLGAAVYIASLYFLVRLISGRMLLQWSLYVCLIFNPFVMDYLVAARGYSLAVGFLVLSVAIAAHHQSLPHDARTICLQRTFGLISVSMALSLSANFSFAIADVLTVVFIWVWLCRRSWTNYIRAAVSAWPGLVVAGFLVGPVAASWPKGQFTWGSTSLSATIHSVLHASIYQPNPYLLHPVFLQVLVKMGPYLFPALGLMFLWRLIPLAIEFKQVRNSASVCRLELMLLCGAVLALSIGCHFFMYSRLHILLPQGRTALFLAPFGTLLIGSVATISVSSRLGRLSGFALTAMLTVFAGYFICCLRLNYFREWEFDAAVKEVYSVISYYNHTYGITAVSADWRYVSALNCYRAISGHETLEEIGPGPSAADRFPKDFAIYVLFWPMEETFMKQEKLKLVYHDRFTDVTVAIRPEVESIRACRSPN